MRIKRYVVNNMQEALYLIKLDLGPDAMIISSHKVREKGLKGWLSPAKIEVTAAITVDKGPPSPPMIQEEPQKKTLSRPDSLVLHKLSQSFSRLETDPEVTAFLLRESDMPQNEKEAEAILYQRLLAVFKPVPAKKPGTNSMAFVGVPGVGKTTTLAKIAANAALFDNLSLAIITIDTFRVGAVEQMKIYGDIIGAVVDVVASPSELAQAVARNQDKDLILIDTAGRPSKNRYQLSEIKLFLEVVENVNIYLVINATTRFRDMMQMINNFRIIPYNQLIISKLDETDSPVTLLNAAYFTGLPIAYITNGQDVPYDIEEADPELLAGYIIRDVIC